MAVALSVAELSGRSVFLLALVLLLLPAGSPGTILAAPLDLTDSVVETEAPEGTVTVLEMGRAVAAVSVVVSIIAGLGKKSPT